MLGLGAGTDRQWGMLDRHEMLLEMPGHHSEVWALAVSSYGDFVVTGAEACNFSVSIGPRISY